MDKTSVAEALRALAGSGSRSDTARLREVLDEVETALASGVTRTAVLETLHELGFSMTAKSFQSALYRLRKRRETSKVHKASTVETHAAVPQIITPIEPRGESDWQNQAGVSPVDNSSGKTRTEQVLAKAPKAFSFKQLQKAAKDPK